MVGCWLTNRSTKERPDAFHAKGSLYQLVMDFCKDYTDEEKRQQAIVFEDVTTHLMNLSCADGIEKKVSPISHQLTNKKQAPHIVEKVRTFRSITQSTESFQSDSAENVKVYWSTLKQRDVAAGE